MNLIKQVLLENTVMSFIAFIFAVCIMELLSPLFTSILDITINASASQLSYLSFLIVGIIFIINISSGVYITSYLSSVKPGLLIKGQIGVISVKENLKKGLIGVQYIIAVFLICCTIIFIKQLNFIKHKDLGFNKDQVLIINSADALGNKESVFINKLEKFSGIKYVTASSWFPNGKTYGYMQFIKDNKPIRLNFVDVDKNFIPMLGIKILQGRNFDNETETDKNQTIIINEKTASILDAKNPIKNGINISGGKYNVIGIVKNFNYMSLRENIGPLILEPISEPLKHNSIRVGVKIKRGEIKESLNYINKIWKEMNPDSEIKYSFLDDDINKLYLNENRLFKAVLSASIIAILIALMGIFALSSFLAETKTKEIAIRKVLGSSASGIVNILSKSFIKIIIFANLVAWPVAYYLMKKWLQNFAYRININYTSFLFSGALVLILSLLTIGFKAYKAANQNPVKSLRSE